MTSQFEFYVSDKLRKKTISKLSNYFNKEISERIELGFYNFTEDYCNNSPLKKEIANGIYKETVNNLIHEFDNSDNKNIKKIMKEIKSNKREPETIAYLKYYEINPEPWKDIIDRRNATKDTLQNLPTIRREKPCKSCGNNEFFYQQFQDRSADEPMSVYYICKNCNRTYRVNR